MPTTRQIWMDILRGLAIFLVIGDHIIDHLISSGFFIHPFIFNINIALEPFRIPTLIVLSGMLLPLSLRKSPLDFFRGKLQYIAYPLVVWYLLNVFMRFSGIVAENTDRASVHLFLQMFSTETGFYLWYLRDLFLFYILFFILRKMPLALLVVASLSISAVPGLSFDAQRFLFLFGFFLIGYSLSTTRLPYAHAPIWLPMIIATLLVIATISAAFLWGNVQYNVIYAPGVMSAIFIAARVSIYMVSRFQLNFLRVIGKNSLIFYVMHWPIVWVTYHILRTAGQDNIFLLFVVPYILSVTLGFIVLYLEKFQFRIQYLFRFPDKIQRLSTHRP